MRSIALLTNCSGVGENNDDLRMPDNLLTTKPGHNDWISTPRDAHSAANDLNQKTKESK